MSTDRRVSQPKTKHHVYVWIATPLNKRCQNYRKGQAFTSFSFFLIGWETRSADPDGVYHECEIAARFLHCYIPESRSGGNYFRTTRNFRTAMEWDGHNHSMDPKEANSDEFYQSKKIIKTRKHKKLLHLWNKSVMVKFPLNLCWPHNSVSILTSVLI